MLVLLVSNGEGQQQGRRPFNKVDSEVCEKGISVFYTVFTESEFSPSLLPSALPPFSTNHVTAQPISPRAYRRAGPN